MYMDGVRGARSVLKPVARIVPSSGIDPIGLILKTVETHHKYLESEEVGTDKYYTEMLLNIPAVIVNDIAADAGGLIGGSVSAWICAELGSGAAVCGTVGYIIGNVGGGILTEEVVTEPLKDKILDELYE